MAAAAASRLKYRTGNLFHKIPQGVILLHACNCVGSWGGGIAFAFKAQFPKAFEAYRDHCLKFKSNPRDLLGTCFIARGEQLGYQYDVGCLFTSEGHGKKVDPPDAILDATRRAVQDLMAQNEEAKPIHSCKFNSGLFNVPWERTEAVLNELGVSMVITEYKDE